MQNRPPWRRQARLLVLATALLFRRIDGLAAMLLVPYLAWIAFATVRSGVQLMRPGRCTSPPT